jgi:hypothetical protein
MQSRDLSTGALPLVEIFEIFRRDCDETRVEHNAFVMHYSNSVSDSRSVLRDSRWPHRSPGSCDGWATFQDRPYVDGTILCSINGSKEDRHPHINDAEDTLRVRHLQTMIDGKLVSICGIAYGVEVVNVLLEPFLVWFGWHTTCTDVLFDNFDDDMSMGTTRL